VCHQLEDTDLRSSASAPAPDHQPAVSGMDERFEYAPEVLEWPKRLNKDELLSRYPAWKYPDSPLRAPKDGVRSVPDTGRET